jgi:calreticulin
LIHFYKRLLARNKMKVLLAFALLGAALSEVFFEETFSDDKWEDRWVQSTNKGDDAGKFVLTAGKFYGDAEKDKGIQTSQDAKFYALSSEFKPFSNKDKPIVVQFTVKHEQNIDCGGGYAKLFDCSLDQTNMHGDSPYHIMFGPDICGPGTKKVHVIFNYKDKNHLIKKDIRCKDDVFSHLYTLIVNPDGTYEVLIDNESAQKGSLTEDWDFLPAKMIKDPAVSKPDDWVDTAKIDDPEDVKPEDWEKPEHIADPDATKPEDWDDEMDGEWEPPMIDNPDYKGEWKPRQIDNPDYKGPWVHPEIANPEYNEDEAKTIAKFDEVCKIGFDLWQVKSGTIFDNIIITDDPAEAKKHGEDFWAVTKEAEKKMKDEQDEEERKKAEAEAKKDEDLDDEDLDDVEEDEEEEEDKAEEHDEL